METPATEPIPSIGDALKAAYSPIDFSEATEADFMTMDRLCDQLKGLFGSITVTELGVQAALQEQGFTFKLIGDNFYWLMRRR